MARNKQPPGADRDEAARQAELDRIGKRAARVAAIVVRLPADSALVPESQARADLLREFGLTAALEAEVMDDPLELVAETAGPMLWRCRAEGRFTPGGHYSASKDEVLAIAEAALEEARGGPSC